MNVQDLTPSNHKQLLCRPDSLHGCQRQFETKSTTGSDPAFNEDPAIVKLFDYLFDQVQTQAGPFCLFVIGTDPVVLIEDVLDFIFRNTDSGVSDTNSYQVCVFIDFG